MDITGCWENSVEENQNFWKQSALIFGEEE
jgi:hypothetical protein